MYLQFFLIVFLFELCLRALLRTTQRVYCN